MKVKTMLVTVMILPKEGKFQMHVWDVENQDQRRQMGKTINEALINGAMILSSANPRRVEFLRDMYDMLDQMRLD